MLFHQAPSIQKRSHGLWGFTPQSGLGGTCLFLGSLGIPMGGSGGGRRSCSLSRFHVSFSVPQRSVLLALSVCAAAMLLVLENSSRVCKVLCWMGNAEGVPFRRPTACVLAGSSC